MIFRICLLGFDSSLELGGGNQPHLKSNNVKLVDLGTPTFRPHEHVVVFPIWAVAWLPWLFKLIGVFPSYPAIIRGLRIRKPKQSGFHASCHKHPPEKLNSCFTWKMMFFFFLKESSFLGGPAGPPFSLLLLPLENRPRPGGAVIAFQRGSSAEGLWEQMEEGGVPGGCQGHPFWKALTAFCSTGF